VVAAKPTYYLSTYAVASATKAFPLSGDMAARILDLAGIVTNRNTIPGDTTAFSASGVRLGTVWISQLGYGPAEIDRLAEAIATLLHGIRPFSYAAMGGKELLRAKVSFDALQKTRQIVRELTGQEAEEPRYASLLIRGEVAPAFLNHALSSDVLGLAVGEAQPTRLHGDPLSTNANLYRSAASEFELRFADAATADVANDWLRALSDGFVQFDDLYAKLTGPVVVLPVQPAEEIAEPLATEEAVVVSKPYFIGHNQYEAQREALPAFEWQEPEEGELRRTSLYDTHVAMGARMVGFGGWDMPVWYSSVSDEHQAVREAAGLFDVSHMGVLEARGPHAADFLNLITTNDVEPLAVGESHYSQLLFPDGSVVDDLLIYRRGPEQYMLVVNASNNDKDWAWLNAVNEGRVRISDERPWIRVQHPAELRDLRDPNGARNARGYRVAGTTLARHLVGA
jgi:glycine hydroxymethyltransferase